MEKTKICPVCGKEFKTSANHKKYCCAKCARDAANNKNMDYILYRTARKAKQNPYLLYAFGFSCGVCGWHLGDDFDILDNNPQNGCEFHHIIPVNEGGTDTEKNLILLCPNCHKLAHAGILTREKLFSLSHTKEEAEEAREKIGLAFTGGTMFVDDFFLRRKAFKKEIGYEKFKENLKKK